MKNLFSKAGIGIALLVAAMVGGVLWGSAATERGVERAVRENFTAAGMLSKLQVEGEKMRRYEKEAFIYVADAAKRKGYMKEFDGAYTKLLTQLDTMLLPSSPYFGDDERKEVLAWKEAAVFYAGQMSALASRADLTDASTLPAEQRAGLTVQFNEGIKAGKERFRVLLGGTEKMRIAKEEAAQQIAGEINATFQRLRLGVIIGGLVVIAFILAALRAPAARGGRAVALKAG